jgi:4-amino-4-deoxy-L-arabinose transferase-like glycosyltransferase
LPAPAQDFPLNDDWSYARSVFQFCRGQGISYGNWPSVPQLGQWLWACPFLWVFGESHVTLRVSTLALSWLGLLAYYDLLRGQQFSAGRATLATTTLAACPLFFLLQGTFMTDVPALSFVLISLALYERGLRRGQVGWLPLACAVAVLGTTTRQNTIVVPIAAGILLCQQPALRRRLGLWLLVLLPAAAGVVTYVWLSGRADILTMKPHLPTTADLIARPFLVLQYCGLAALPFLICKPWIESPARFAAMFGLMLTMLGQWLLFRTYRPYGAGFPYFENMLTPWGAFAAEALFVAGEPPLLLGPVSRWALTLLGCVLGAGLLARITQRRCAGIGADVLVLFTIFQIPFLLILRWLFDRYLLFFIPGAIALAATCPPPTGEKPERPWHFFLSWALALSLLTISVSLMHDWLAWNSARWALGRRALARGVAPLDIEGGVEWNGWYGGHLFERPRQGPERVLAFTYKWFPATRGRYVLSFSDRLPVAIDSEPYSLWLLPGKRHFYLLQPFPTPKSSVQSPRIHLACEVIPGAGG